MTDVLFVACRACFGSILDLHGDTSGNSTRKSSQGKDRAIALANRLGSVVMAANSAFVCPIIIHRLHQIGFSALYASQTDLSYYAQ